MSSSGGAQSNQKRVCIIGAGIIGLSTAVRIQEESEGWGPGMVEVTVMADRYSPHTTSDGSGGFWEPYNLGDTPPDLIRRWSEATWHHLYHLAMSPELAGVLGAQFVSGYQLSDSLTVKVPFYKDTVLGFRQLTPRELSMFPFARFKSAGGKLENKTVQTLSQAAKGYDVIVNCGGPRAGQLVSDTQTLPIRGQLRRVHAPWIKHFYIMASSKEGDSSYVLPLGDEILVGGVAQRHNWKEEVDVEDSERIWTRALANFPFLKGGRTTREWAGLRPGRSVVRLDTDIYIAGGRPVPVVNNYGHGGSGVTLHWGCAADATALVRSALLHTPRPASSKL